METSGLGLSQLGRQRTPSYGSSLQHRLCLTVKDELRVRNSSRKESREEPTIREVIGQWKEPLF